MKLASIEQITSVTEIKGADKIVLVTVLGWQTVVQRGKYNVGDLCVFIPIDTQVNTCAEHFSFLATSEQSTWKKIKTVKIRGVYSQGLVISISSISSLDDIDYKEGDDVSEYLSVRKYEKVCNDICCETAQTHVAFPVNIINKTDEDNLRTCIPALQELHNKQLYITMKMDGSSMTIIKKDNEFMVCSRNMVVDESSEMYKFVVCENIRERLSLHLGDNNIAIQGEFCGPKINGNRLGLTTCHFYVFTVKHLDTGNCIGFDEMTTLCTTLELEVVPLVTRCYCDETFNIDTFQKIANSIMYTLPNNSTLPGEGIVIRPIVPIYSDLLEKLLSVKVINQEYND